MIYLKHPIHGTKVAISREEADYDKGLGWVEFDPTGPLDHDHDGKPGGSLAGDNAVARRRGRPPKVVE